MGGCGRAGEERTEEVKVMRWKDGAQEGLLGGREVDGPNVRGS